MTTVQLSRAICALVFADDVSRKLNGIRAKLTERGFFIKKEINSESKNFDFSMVDLVIAVANNLRQGPTDRIRAAAAAQGKQLLFLSRQSSRFGWDRLEEFGREAFEGPPVYSRSFGTPESPSPRTNGVPSSVVSVPLNTTAGLASLPLAMSSRGEDGTRKLLGALEMETKAYDTATTELFSILERERNDARKQAQKLAGELGNVRLEIGRLTRERDEFATEVKKAKARESAAGVKTEAATLGEKEAREQGRAWAERLKRLESDLKAAQDQNARLVKERNEDRKLLEEALTETPTTGPTLEEHQKLKAERDDYMNKFRMNKAHMDLHVRSNRDLRLKNAVLEKRVSGEGGSVSADFVPLEEFQKLQVERDDLFAKYCGSRSHTSKHVRENQELREKKKALEKELKAAGGAGASPVIDPDTAKAILQLVKSKVMTSEEGLSKLVSLVGLIGVDR
jgi:hypothetical protein